jgi:hypothetical protein
VPMMVRRTIRTEGQGCLEISKNQEHCILDNVDSATADTKFRKEGRNYPLFPVLSRKVDRLPCVKAIDPVQERILFHHQRGRGSPT